MTSDPPVRVAVIGAGQFGARHVAAYLSLGVPVAALVDPNETVLQQVAAQFGVAQTFTTVDELLDATSRSDAPINAASVCAPGRLHRQVTIPLLHAGVPVMVEKPLATTVDDAEAIVALAEATGVICQPGHILRFAAPYRALYDEVSADRLGQVYAISSRRDRPRTLSRQFPSEHPALLTAVHDIDLALWYSGSPVVEVRAIAHGHSKAAPALVWAELRHASGVVSSIRNSYLLPEDTANHTSDLLEVYAHGGVGRVDLTHPTLLVQADGAQSPDWLLAPAQGGGALSAQLRHFLLRVTGAESSAVVPLHDGLHVVRVAAAIIGSAAADGASRRVAR